MHGVRARITSLAHDLFRLDGLDQGRRARIGLGIDDIDARRADAGNDEIAALEVHMARQRRQRGTAGIPAEMVEFVAGMRHDQLVDHRAVGGRLRIDVDHGQRIGPRAVR